MGTSRSAAELAGKFANLAAEVPGANKEAVSRSALLGKDIMIQGAVQAGLRRGGKLPAHGTKAWNARYDIKGTGNPTALLRYVGPVHWAFGGTSPHIIGARRYGTRTSWRRRYGNSIMQGMSGAAGAKRGRGKTLAAGRGVMRSGRGAQALRFGGRFALYSLHPGSTGRDTWPTTKRRIEQMAPREFHKAHKAALRRARF